VTEPDIRALTLDDLPAYKALRDGMLEAHPDAFTSDAASERAKPALAFADRIGTTDGGGFSLGAWCGGELVGAISIEREQRLKVRHIGHVIGMMVRDDQARLGIGRLLLAGAIARCRELAGLEMLTLTVTHGNRAAQALYEQAGFECYGCLRRAIKLGDRYLDKDHMALVL